MNLNNRSQMRPLRVASLATPLRRRSRGIHRRAASPPPTPPAARWSGEGRIGETRSAGTVVILSIITLGIYNIYWQYKVFQEMKDYSGQGIGGGIALILAIFVGFVNPFIMGSEIANIYRSEGQEPPVTAATGAWILLPFVGFIIWIVKCQNALNDLWIAHGAQPA